MAAERLAGCAQLGVRIALDDFGAGYTSLRQLQRFPVDIVKLDPIFVRRPVGRTTGVLDGLVSMANSLGLETVGEGIEERAPAATPAATPTAAWRRATCSRRPVAIG